MDEGRLPGFRGRIYSIAEDTTGALWAGSDGAVLRVNVPSTGMRNTTFQKFASKDEMAKAANNVELAGGNIFLSGAGKMLRWDETAGNFVKDERFLLPVKDATFTRLTAFENGDVWSLNNSSGEQRQGMFRRQTDGSYRVDEASFLGLSRFGGSKARLEPDGTLWLASDDGVVRFDQRAIPPPRPPFSALLRRVLSGPDAIVFGGIAQSGQPSPRLPFARNSLQFEFAAPTYNREAETVYRYRLEGADRDWSGWDKRTQTSYGNLGPGSYRLRVQARTWDGRVSEEGVYSFTILPPWYRTWLAYGVYAALLVLLAEAGRRYVVKREREKAKRQRDIECNQEHLAALQHELETAGSIQSALIPRVFPPFPDRTDFDIHAQMTAASSVGGDFFDFFLLDRDHLGIVIGDVSGKGVPAALYMAIALTHLRNSALQGLTPEECMREVNRVLVREDVSNMFATCLYGILDTRNGAFRYSRAGHCLPYVLRASGAVEAVEAVGGLPLGLFEGNYAGASVQLEPGDALFLYTDGVTEAVNPAVEEFTDEQLMASLKQGRSLGCQGLIDTVTRDLAAFTSTAPQFDDFTMLCVQLRG